MPSFNHENSSDKAQAKGGSKKPPKLVVNDTSALSVTSYKPPLVLDHTTFGPLTVLCAEPGMGKSHVASVIEHVAKNDGRDVYRYAFDDAGSECISKRMVRRCSELRSHCKNANHPVVIIDGVTPADEFQARREAAAIERLIDEGAQVVVCIRPEAEQLAERLSAADVLNTSQLLFRPYDEDESDYAMTGGIPALVMGQVADSPQDATDGVAGTRYLDALDRIARLSLRHGLMDEELRTRLAMMLLGEGTMADVAEVAGRCDAEALCLLARDSALFGIDVARGTFRCCGLHLDSVLEQCLGALQAVASTMSDLVVRACNVLASQRRLVRSALVCRLCSSRRDFAAVGTSWGVLFAAVGEGGLVEEALRAAREHNLPETPRMLLSSVAAASIHCPAAEMDELREKLDAIQLSTAEEERLLRTTEHLLATRGLFRSPNLSTECLLLESGDAMGAAFLDNLRISRLMRSGRFCEAYSLISNEMIAGEPNSLPEALVCDERFFSLALCGGSPDEKERLMLAGAERVFERSGMRHLRTYHRALKSAALILMSDMTDTGLLEEASTRADRVGDSYFQAFCLAVASVADMRTHALTRAHVRAARAAAIARALGEAYLASAAGLVNALACELLGDAGALVGFCNDVKQPEGLLLMGRLLATASESIPAGFAAADISLGAPCPRDELWALNMLATSGLSIWKGVASLLPSTWLDQLRLAQDHYRSHDDQVFEDATSAPMATDIAISETSLGSGAQTQLGFAESGTPAVHVSLLGGFAVMCDGAKASERAFRRRRSRELMMLLAIVPGHRMRRYQIIEAMFEELDYSQGTRLLYEATGEARKCLTELCGDVDPIKSKRSQGTVGFDVSMVSCDVDEFERVARKALTEGGDDFQILEYGRAMARLYSSGPDERLMLMGDLVKSRVVELQQLFVDASVAVGEAALRLGKAKLAIHYATDAHKLDDLREDVVMLLIRALKAAGRGFEVKPLYRQYCRRLGDALGILPSVELRRAVELTMSQGEGE